VRQVGFTTTYTKELTESSETLAYKLQTPANHPEESIQHSEHGESLKSTRRMLLGLLDPVDEGTALLHNIGNYSYQSAGRDFPEDLNLQ
jgi:hypothetical protein